MTKPQVHVHDDLEELSRAVADRFLELAKQRVSEAGSFTVALSGGSTPRRLYQLLASSDYGPRMEWGKLHLFQVDERCVPPDHAMSNFRMIRESLLTPAGVPAANFHRVRGEMAPEDAAGHYASDLEKSFSTCPPHFPQFDLLFLGMGADGHVASIFPGSATLVESARWVAVSEPGPEGLKRVTLTLPVLNAAAHIIFIVSGAEKSETLARALEAPDLTGSLPVQCVRPASGSVSWFLDQAAASRLQFSRTT
jgi:6-phosphogluconolactonase